MIHANELIALFRKAREEGWGYIWGKRGQVWTQENQDAATRAQTVKYGKKWVGKRVADCSGLFAWAFEALGGYIYHGSNTIWKKYCAEKGEITAGAAIRPGTAVFQVKGGTRTHIGLYVGGGTVIEAKGAQYGVVESAPADWDEWGELAGVDYAGLSPEPVKIPRKTLKRGSRGAAVAALQERLNALSYDCGEADGVFGAKTRLAVIALQQDCGLQADGVVGPKTWTALDASDPSLRYRVIVSGLTESESNCLLAAWGDRAVREKLPVPEGGDHDE